MTKQIVFAPSHTAVTSRPAHAVPVVKSPEPQPQKLSEPPAAPLAVQVETQPPQDGGTPPKFLTAGVSSWQGVSLHDWRRKNVPRPSSVAPISLLEPRNTGAKGKREDPNNVAIQMARQHAEQGFRPRSRF